MNDWLLHFVDRQTDRLTVIDISKKKYGWKRQSSVRAQFDFTVWKNFISDDQQNLTVKWTKTAGKNTYMTSEEKKTKEQNINEVQSLLGGLIGLPERDRA